MQLEAQRRAQHHLGPERRQRAALRPRPPAVAREVETAGHGRRVVQVRGTAGAQHEVARPIDPERPPVGDRGRRHVGVQVEAVRPAQHLEAVTGDGQVDRRAGVVGARIEHHVQARRALERPHQSVDLDRRAHPETRRQPRREIENLAGALFGSDHRAHDVRVAHVGHLGIGRRTFGDELETAARRLVEQAREHRRAVEARQAQPVDRGVRAHQGQHAAVANRPMGEVGGRRHRRRPASLVASASRWPAQS